MFMIMSILNELMEMQVAVYTVKEGYKLGQDLQSKVLAFAFSISAEIERNLIAERTTEGRSDIGSENDPDGLLKGQKTGIDEPDEHDGRDARRLRDRGDDAPGKNACEPVG